MVINDNWWNEHLKIIKELIISNKWGKGQNNDVLYELLNNLIVQRNLELQELKNRNTELINTNYEFVKSSNKISSERHEAILEVERLQKIENELNDEINYLKTKHKEWSLKKAEEYLKDIEFVGIEKGEMILRMKNALQYRVEIEQLQKELQEQQQKHQVEIQELVSQLGWDKLNDENKELRQELSDKQESLTTLGKEDNRLLLENIEQRSRIQHLRDEIIMKDKLLSNKFKNNMDGMFNFWDMPRQIEEALLENVRLEKELQELVKVKGDNLLATGFMSVEEANKIIKTLEEEHEKKIKELRDDNHRKNQINLQCAREAKDDELQEHKAKMKEGLIDLWKCASLNCDTCKESLANLLNLNEPKETYAGLRKNIHGHSMGCFCKICSNEPKEE